VRKESQQPRSLRIATYNIHDCVGIDGIRAPLRILEVLRGIDADVLLLQELSNSRDDQIGGMLVEMFAHELGMHAVQGATLTRDDAEYGNLCLTRIEPTWFEAHDISVAGYEPRGLLEVGISVGGASVRILGTHLGLRPKERARQYQQIRRILTRNQTSRTTLAGDFNDLRLPRQLHSAISGSPSILRRRTFPSRWPALPLDRIHAWPASSLCKLATENGDVARRASDHLPLIAEITLDGLQACTVRPKRDPSPQATRNGRDVSMTPRKPHE